MDFTPKGVARHQSQALAKLRMETSIKKLKEQKKVAIRKRTSYLLVSKHAKQHLLSPEKPKLTKPPPRKEHPGISQLLKLANGNTGLPCQNNDSDSESGSEDGKNLDDCPVS